MSPLVLLVLASASAPDRVVVFPDRAQVTRTAALTCGSRVTLVFDHIPPAAAEGTFRATVTSGTVDGLRAELVSKEAEFSPRVAELESSLERLRHELERTADALQRAALSGRTGRQLTDLAARLVSEELASPKPDPKAWHLAFDASLTTSLASAKETASLNQKLRALRVEEARAQLALQEVQAFSEKKAWRVEVLASCPSGTTTELSLTYLVGGASWAPTYEARADERQRTVELSTWATVQQGTGEPWDQVELTLSTALPSQNATTPALKVLEVSAQERPPEKKVLVRRDETVASISAGSNRRANESDSGLVARGQGLSVQLVVPERATVAGTSTPARLFVGKATMQASFELRAIPKLAPGVFRVAELTNQGAWPLLPGRVDLFRSTGLVSRTSLERVAQGGVFTLTFGLEDSVRAKRTILEELKRDTGLFNGTRRFTYGYSFELANYGPTPVELSVAEHVPVSELDDIVVTVEEKTTAGYALNPLDGIATWKVPLRPGEKKTVLLWYRVEVPTSYETAGL